MSLVISPPLMKCAESALGGVRRGQGAALAINDCAMSWPPNVRIGFLLGWDPMNRSSSTRLRSRTASSSSKSAIGHSALGQARRRAAQALLHALQVILPDPVDVDQVG